MIEGRGIKQRKAREMMQPKRNVMNQIVVQLLVLVTNNL